MTALVNRPQVRARRRGVLTPAERGAVVAGRLAGAASRWAGRGRGSTLPGRVALWVVPDLLTALARGRTVVLVSGTNGKSTTTRYLTCALATRGPVPSNSDGANMRAGLATTLMTPGAAPGQTVVLEIDEHVLVSSAGEVQPALILLLNLTRDQLDRTCEVTSLVRGWAAALRHVRRAVVVANADDPLVCAAVRTARPAGDGVSWVAAGQPWRRDCPLCPLCAAQWVPGPQWRCPSCGFERPAPAWRLVGDGVQGPDGLRVPLRLQLPGRANRANAAMAIAGAAELGVAAPVSAAAMRPVSDVDGRYLRTAYGGTRVRLLLAKNPAGWAEVLDELAGTSDPLVLAVNSRGADGADTSWLWDVPFEQLHGRTVVAAGERSADLALRLRYAGVAHTREPDVLTALRGLDEPSTQVIANYTAFTRARDQLAATVRPARLPSAA